jgi:hypothetical protein
MCLNLIDLSNKSKSHRKIAHVSLRSTVVYYINDYYDIHFVFVSLITLFNLFLSNVLYNTIFVNVQL